MPPVMINPTLVPASAYPVGPGASVVQSGGKSGEAFVAEIHDRFYQQTLAGNSYIATGPAAGVTPPAYNATTQVFGLWNPQGSGKNAVLISLDVGHIVAPVVVSCFALSLSVALGANIGTAAPVPTGTATAPVNLLLGTGNSSAMRYMSAATLTTAPTLLQPILGSVTVVTTAVWNIVVQHHDFQGRVVVAPGAAVWFTSIAAQTASSTIPALSWYEAAQ